MESQLDEHHKQGNVTCGIRVNIFYVNVYINTLLVLSCQELLL